MCGLFLTVKFSCLFTAVAVLACLTSVLRTVTTVNKELNFSIEKKSRIGVVCTTIRIALELGADYMSWASSVIDEI